MNFVAQHVIVNILEKQIEFSVPVFKSTNKKSLVPNHLLECEHFNYVVNLHNLPPSNNIVEYLEHVMIAVYGNTKIIGNTQNWIMFFRKPSHQMEETKTELWH